MQLAPFRRLARNILGSYDPDLRRIKLGFQKLGFEQATIQFNGSALNGLNFKIVKYSK
jgi:hypothetical protein